MSDDANAFQRVASTREEAHEAITQAYGVAKVILLNGQRVSVSVAPHEDELSVRQRKFLHGPVLGQISEQVRVGGERYVMQVWKEHLRKLFLPDKWEMRRIPKWDPEKREFVAPKRATPYRVRVSTEDLSIKRYSRHIEQVIAHAATEWGVVFSLDPKERDEARYKAPTRKKAATEEAAA